jgi:hypothetical protein
MNGWREISPYMGKFYERNFPHKVCNLKRSEWRFFEKRVLSEGWRQQENGEHYMRRSFMFRTFGECY